MEDARNIGKLLKNINVDVTITSPPYFDMKDYGVKNQIGFGQEYINYLDDVKSVFRDIFAITKETGSLWVIIDTFKRNGEIVLLPFDLSRVLEEIGWKLKDILIWKKDRTLPWVSKGESRKIFEYILFFTKGNDFKYYIDRVRSKDNLKNWWVRYPERYNPHGKSPEKIWEFNIPRQGAWGKNLERHFCPLPQDLVAQIINLTTDEGDVVIDPFAGLGTVLSQAAFMKRKYYGTELNKQYISIFEKNISMHLRENILKYENERKSDGEFYTNIVNLRVLKYGRLLVRRLINDGFLIKKIYIEKNNDIINAKRLAFAKYVIESVGDNGLINKIEKIISKPPFSKFEIQTNFIVIKSFAKFRKTLTFKYLYTYTGTNTHQFVRKVEAKRENVSELIVSPIQINIEV